MLDLARLRVLREVACHGSLTRAAAALSYTTSALSQQISVLEREAGARLLERHARGVRLTEAGRALLEHTERIMTELRAAESTLAAIRSGEGGRLRFGSFTTANATLMPLAVRAFLRERPGVSVELVEADRDEAVAAVAAHELDLALVYEFPAVPLVLPSNVEVRPLLVDPLYIALPPGHRQAGRARVRLADLAGERWIQGVHRGSTVDVLPQACRQAGFEPVIAFRTDDQMTVRGLVAAGLGVALAPFLTLPATAPDLVVRPLSEPSLTRTVMTATPALARRLPAAVAMIGHLRSVAAELRSAGGLDEPRARPLSID
ncbi:DNA-binding transcriptional LysR family regulator [Nonomuraea thailandensis]|uniref:DNA-binding transcriptional LysR family regulator n=1 Tax=Nonomuraea thailandensis TaxID=1188745 RepID=A0A9X2GDB2_9ACTN|nr:LysR family transcriptional regulator [Nonomuraea thailandensis]MCP2357029.1 DNA-binding transcriptional LysR family regulator [Nonomuraea thailandensis]